MSRTVHLHIGLAKSGTTYLQHVLQANKAPLEEHGTLFPGPKMSAHFLAALDLGRGSFQGHRYPGVAGAWDRIVAAADRFAGTTVISHEMLAALGAPAVERAVGSFGTDDVRVVVTARDLGRQIPAVWQERLKNGHRDRYVDFLDAVLAAEKSPARTGFWRQQDLARICDRWASRVGRDRFTVVTVPPRGAQPDQLWRRFADAVGLPRIEYDLDVAASNVSLGPVESELLRRLQAHLPELAWSHYVARVKRRFAQGMLAASTSGRLVVPPPYQAEVARLAEEAVTSLRQLGGRVVGDLDELRPVFPAGAPELPDTVEDAVLLDRALDLLAGLVAAPPPRPRTDASAPGAAAAPRRLLTTMRSRLRRR